MKYGTQVPPGTLLKIKAHCDNCEVIGTIGGKVKYGVYRGYGKDKLCSSCAHLKKII